MPDDIRISIVEEEAHLAKRATAIERVTVHTSFDEDEVVVRDALRRERVELTRVPVEREVAEAPAVRSEGNVTIIPVLEERLVIEKRLFLVEEIHLTRSERVEAVELPTTVRRTRVDVERTDLSNTQEDLHGSTE